MHDAAPKIHRVIRSAPRAERKNRYPCAAGCHRTARTVGARCRICLRDNRPVVIHMVAPTEKLSADPEHVARIAAHAERITREQAELKARQYRATDDDRSECKRSRQRRNYRKETVFIQQPQGEMTA